MNLHEALLAIAADLQASGPITLDNISLGHILQKRLEAVKDDFHDRLRANFERQISSKTGWGKNEVMQAFDKALIDTLLGK